MAEVFLMMKEMEVWDLTRFAEGHGAALQVRANNCTALRCLPCCCPFASISHRASRGQGVPLLGSCGGMTPLSSSICHPKILEHISRLELLEPGTAATLGERAAWQTLLCTWLRVQCPKSAFSLCLQYLLHSEQSQQQVPFGGKCHDLVLGTASIMVQKEKNPASFVTFLMSWGFFSPCSVPRKWVS